MTDLTKTEAADILANKVRVVARYTGHVIDKDLVEAILSESRHLGGVYRAAYAARPSWRTILRLAKTEAYR